MATLAFKWNGKAQEVGLEGLDTLGDLKARLFTLLDVRPANQKLIGLKLKAGGKADSDETVLEELELGPKTKLILMGQTDEVIEKASQLPDEQTQFVDELGTDGTEAEDTNCPSHLSLRLLFDAKIDRRIKEYKLELKNALRPGKKLLVLDIDYTIYDHRSEAESIQILMRPHLHDFLAAVYAFYDIAIWSATGMKWIDAKLKEMGVGDCAYYKISFCMDAYAMISIHTPELGSREVKPLRVVWGKLPETSPQATIMFDDVGTNFFMNPLNGLKIRPYKRSHMAKDTDRELVDLAQYLIAIAEREDDFTTLRHSRWRRYMEKLPTEPKTKVPKQE